jgi:hypothetical protein
VGQLRPSRLEDRHPLVGGQIAQVIAGLGGELDPVFHGTARIASAEDSAGPIRVAPSTIGETDPQGVDRPARVQGLEAQTWVGGLPLEQAVRRRERVSAREPAAA